MGLGGYLLSAAAGLDEPPLLGVAVRSDDLAAQARAPETSRDLDPHRFTESWFCGRAVTDGRITGLARARVDGSPALLVFTREDGSAQVTVVAGCTTRLALDRRRGGAQPLTRGPEYGTPCPR